MEKEKKIINVLTAFFIFHKSDVKTFLKWILKQCHMALVNMTLYFLKKSQNDVILAQLTTGHNWSLTEYQINNN